MPNDAPLVAQITQSPGAPPLDLGRLTRLLAFAAAREGASGEVGVWICSDDEIAELHERFMQIPGPTDVLSFPGDEAGPEGAYLGDIAVSFDTAALQAADVGHDTAREIVYLTLHGLLHLIGYDDLDPDGRSEMLGRQDALLATFEEEYPGAWS
jgi:probable rRNA maturation factor